MLQPALAAFFSYSRSDSDFAQRLAKSLRAAGATIWFDQLDIQPGKRWDSAVEEALARCPSMLVILSPSSVESTNVMDEVSFALEEGKTVIPVLYRDCKIPFRLRRVQYLDFRADYDEGVRELLKTLLPEYGGPAQTKEGTTQPEHEIEQAHADTLPPQRLATPEVPTGPSVRSHSTAALPLVPAARSVTQDPAISAPGSPQGHPRFRLLVAGALVGLLGLLAVGAFVALTFNKKSTVNTPPATSHSAERKTPDRAEEQSSQGQVRPESSAEQRSKVVPKTSVHQPAVTTRAKAAKTTVSSGTAIPKDTSTNKESTLDAPPATLTAPQRKTPDGFPPEEQPSHGQVQPKSSAEKPPAVVPKTPVDRPAVTEARRTVVSSGTAIITGNWVFDLDTESLGSGDIWWAQRTAVLRQMTPKNGAQIVNLGVVDFNSITPDSLFRLSYSATPVPGNNDHTNELITGDVFAVRTKQGNYAKVKVVSYGYNMQIQWVTYQH